ADPRELEDPLFWRTGLGRHDHHFRFARRGRSHTAPARASWICESRRGLRPDSEGMGPQSFELASVRGSRRRQTSLRWEKRKEKTMSEYAYLFRGRQASPTPEQRQKQMEKWMAWFKELGANGHLKDPGHPLEPTGRVIGGDRNIVKDGPFAETKDVVGGYIVVEAE